MDGIYITVILCTYNRCESLKTALDSLVLQEMPDSLGWEVLVVDNNSHDRTAEVVKEFARTCPGRFRYLFEPRQGKSHALNSGIKHAHGDFLAFTDDDVRADRTWLRNLARAFGEKNWAGVGGRIFPEQPFTPPSWIPLQDKYALAPLAVFTPELDAGPLLEAPFGANMAYAKHVFEKYGGFRTDLGPQASGCAPQKSEDSEFGQRLLAVGERLGYEPGAVVYHAVPAERLQKKYFLAWWRDKAQADIRAFGIPNRKWLIGGMPLYLFRRLAVWTLRWLVSIDPARRFSCKVKVWSKVGEIVECYRQSHVERVAPRTKLA